MPPPLLPNTLPTLRDPRWATEVDPADLVPVPLELISENPPCEPGINKWARNGFGVAVNQAVGKFSSEESDVVRRAVEDYCALKNISTARLCSECDHKAELKGAWMEIAKQLPHRSVQSVYRHGIRQMHPFKRGAWSDQECVMLNELVQLMGKKWSAIQAKLNRSADSCRDKYREMSEEYVKGRWKDQEIEMLKQLIRGHLNAEPDIDMRELGRIVEEQDIQIPWSDISKRMGKRSRLSCFKKWQKMVGLTGPIPASVTEPMEGFPDGINNNNNDPQQQQQQHAYQHHSEDLEEESSRKRVKMDPEDQLDHTHHHDQLGAVGHEDDSSQQHHHHDGRHHHHHHHHHHSQTHYDDMYSAKIAAETVEAVDLPNVHDVAK